MSSFTRVYWMRAAKHGGECSKNKKLVFHSCLTSGLEAVLTVAISAVFCTTLLRMDKAEEVLMDMRANGIAPNTVTYGSFIHGYCLAGDLDSAFGTIEAMIQDQCAPSPKLVQRYTQHQRELTATQTSFTARLSSVRRRLDDRQRQKLIRFDRRLCLCFCSLACFPCFLFRWKVCCTFAVPLIDWTW